MSGRARKRPAFAIIITMYVFDPGRVTYFAQTDSRNKRVAFGIKADDRSRHMYVIGKTGMGKSTLLENMAVQDIQNGEGIAFIDPHGSTAEKLLEYIPKERLKDVLYFAPFDLAYPISFNVMEDVPADKRHLVISGLMATFEKIWEDAWSARMSYILQNTLAALLEYPGATLLGVNRMYIDKEYRKRVVDNITDPTVRSFWVDEYTKFTDRYTQEATPAIQNKIGQFSSNPLIRNIIGQPTSSFDLREIMDTRKIFIVNLSKGRVGEGNANLLGSMLITKIYLAAMSRADVAASQMSKMPYHYLYVDEFQSFANKSFADILSEARKYKLSLTMAHQYIEQMEEEVRAAVFGNVGTMISFRVGAYDAEVLEKEYAPTFTAVDIVNLGARQIYLKLMIDGISSQPFSATTLPPIELPVESNKDLAIAYSRKNYSRPRSEVEKGIVDWHAPVEPPPAALREKLMAEETGGRDRRPPMRDRPQGNDRPREERRDERRDERPREHRDRDDRFRDDRPPARRPAEKTADDLRATLLKVAKKSEEKEERKEPPPSPPVAPAVPPVRPQREPAMEVRPPKERAPVTPSPKPSPKDATEADRNDLRNALSSLMKNRPQKSEVPETPQEWLKETNRPEPARAAPVMPPPGASMTPEELRKLLSVEPDR